MNLVECELANIGDLYDASTGVFSMGGVRKQLRSVNTQKFSLCIGTLVAGEKFSIPVMRSRYTAAWIYAVSCSGYGEAVDGSAHVQIAAGDLVDVSSVLKDDNLVTMTTGGDYVAFNPVNFANKWEAELINANMTISSSPDERFLVKFCGSASVGSVAVADFVSIAALSEPSIVLQENTVCGLFHELAA
jgi:hypothetical protein